MKVRREILIIFSMILLLVLPATSLGKEIKWVLERPVIPVLVKKPASPVLKVTLIRADNQPYTIQQIDLDLLGSTDVADVVSVAIYGTQENGLIDTSRLLYKALPAARKISFTDKVQVNQDSLSFWVAVTLKDTVSLDHLMSNDGTTHLTVDMYRNKLKNPHIADAKKVVFIVDHNVPSDCPKTAASQKKMRDFAKENNIDFWEGKGVCHQVMMENYVCSGELIFGADSHTCSYGALGAFGTGVGCTDFLYGMVTGKSWVLVPETVKFNLVGKLPEGVYARDLILTIIGEIGANGCNYQVMEFTGEGAKSLSISERMVLCNMAVEAGAKTGIFEADEKALEYLEAHGRKPKAVYKSDPDAVYAREYTFDLSKVRPVAAKPDFVDNVVPAEEVRGIKIDEAFLGSCNNGRIEDLRVGASIIKGKKVAEKVRFLVVPASQTVYRQALKEGLIDIFMEAGAIVMNPNCSVCWGSCQGVIGENEVLISTGTRNFKGRAGHPSSKVYLGSAATVTASAIAGEIALAEDVM